MDTTDILTNIGVLVGTAVAAWIAYKTKNPYSRDQSQNSVVAGVGIELGNREQTERLIAEQKRCADGIMQIASGVAVLADKKQAAMEVKMDEMQEVLERLAEREKRN